MSIALSWTAVLQKIFGDYNRIITYLRDLAGYKKSGLLE